MMAKFAIAALLLLIGSCNCVSMSKKSVQILDALFKEYDPRVRPPGSNATDPNAPVIVWTNLFVRSLNFPDPTKMEYETQLTFRQQWQDPRLRFQDMGGIKYLNQQELNKIWLPDTFFSNELQGSFHDLMKPNRLIRIYPDGNILYSVRVSLKLSCPMNLVSFPMDRQVCSLIMASYGSTTDDLVYLWKEADPVQVTKNLNTPLFSLEKFFTDYCNSKTNTGTYSCMKIDFVFKRDFAYYCRKLICPSWILVLISWVAFWLGRHHVTARVLLGLATTLGIMVVHNSAFDLIPNVGYTIKPISTWFKTCESFALLALVELVVVLLTSKNIDGEEGERSKGIVESDANFLKRLLTRISPKTHPVDLLSRMLFPLAFIIFNIIYFTTV